MRYDGVRDTHEMRVLCKGHERIPFDYRPASLDLVVFGLVLFGAAAKPAPIVTRAKRRRQLRRAKPTKPAPKTAALRVVAVA
jgi:hypothetical protein